MFAFFNDCAFGRFTTAHRVDVDTIAAVNWIAAVDVIHTEFVVFAGVFAAGVIIEKLVDGLLLLLLPLLSLLLILSDLLMRRHHLLCSLLANLFLSDDTIQRHQFSLCFGQQSRFF